ncbi:DUF6249 domain-containing protein [Marivirga salinae]|uniref:DUF6249 domain-containing protein n=1 Tax=Marivirga salinarum TaxID=3059078 RepID=A0AA51NAS4_9BACT|nr:DUF6249 domain-containing protein [Marivirga sp. BDSF4-3]WMN11525.1 DUF6249 domain-containing protein [Marivirga sp. BDSF4-3]
MEAAITFISLFATIFGISYYFLYTRNKERLAMIESGADASLFQAPKLNRKRHPVYSVALVLGMMAMGIGLGIIFAVLFDHSIELKNGNEEAFYFSGIFIFGGLGLVSSFLTLRWLDKKDEEK